jgi:hypothetical protein
MSEIIVTDITKDRGHSYDLFLEEVARIKTKTLDDFSLRDNYTSIDLAEFHSFDVVTYCGELFSFAGLQKRDIWPLGSARGLSRMYISDKFRQKTLLAGFRRSIYAAQLQNVYKYIFFPRQINHAKKIGLKAVFFSRADPTAIKQKSLASLLRRINEDDSADVELEVNEYSRFVLLDRAVNVCGVDVEECWQNVYYFPTAPGITDQYFYSVLPNISIKEFHERYQNDE